MGLGATSIGVGALYGTGAFSSVSAGRGISVNAAGDKDALLGINEEVYPVEFANNTSSFSMEVTLESTAMSFDVNDDGEFEEPATFNLEPAETQDDPDVNEVALQGDDGTVSISVDLLNNGSNVGSIDLDRFFEVPGVAAIRQVTGSVREAFGNGRYQFSLTNESDDDITLDGFGVEWTDNPDATFVGRDQGNDAILEADDVQRIDERFAIDGEVNDVIDGEEVELGSGVEMEFEAGRFSDDGSNGVAVNDIDLVVRGSDDPDRTVTVELRAD